MQISIVGSSIKDALRQMEVLLRMAEYKGTSVCISLERESNEEWYVGEAYFEARINIDNDVKEEQ